MLVVVVGIKDVEFGVNLFGRMGTEFQLAVDHILHHLQHAVFHLLGVMRLFDVLFQQSQTLFLYLFLGTKEEFSSLVGMGDVFVHIDANKDAHFVDTVKERTQCEIS